MPRSCLIDGSLTPGELVRLIEWLPDTSAFSAAVMGGPEWMGWGVDRVLRREMHLFTHAAVSKKQPKPFPLPEPSRNRQVKVRSLAALPGAVRRRKET